jgi:hypothetical protein
VDENVERRMAAIAVLPSSLGKGYPEDAITFPKKDEEVERVKQLRVKFAVNCSGSGAACNEPLPVKDTL